MDIREAKPSDAEVLAVLCIAVWIDTYSVDGLGPVHASYVLAEYTPKNLAQRIEQRSVFVAEYDGNVVGLVILNEDSGEIESLYVLSRFKGLGAGSSLLEVIRKKYEGRLFLTCWEGNHDALEFYKKVGFDESGEAFFILDGKRIRNIELSSS